MLDLAYENNYLSNRDNYSDIKLLMRLLGNNNYDLVSRLHNLIVLKKSNISKDDLQKIGLSQSEIDDFDTIFSYFKRQFNEDKFEVISARDIFLLIQPYFSSTQENVIVINLNQQYQVIDIHQVFLGFPDQVYIHLRDLFKYPIKSSATSFIIAHSHPFGKCSPSDDDISATRRIKRMSKVLGIELYDHVIFNDKTYYSFLENLKL